MGKSKAPSLPNTPEFFSDQRFQGGTDDLFDLGGRLTNFDFSGGLSPLQDTIDLDPEVSKLALQFAQGSLTPAFNRQRQDSVNQLANLGALESSTTSNAFAQQDENLNSQFQSIVAGASLDDRSRALNNRIGLFGTGLNTLSGATEFAGQNQQQRNNFNIQNFENIIAKALGEQKSQKGGFMGALTGGAGGAALGLALAPFTGGSSLLLAGLGGLGGGLAGGFGPSGTGGQILGAGSSSLALRPGSTAGAGQASLNNKLGAGMGRNLFQNPTGNLSFGF